MPSRNFSLALWLALLIVLANAVWSYLDWQDLRESGGSRMLATSHTKRYVTNPGIEAWLVNLLERAGERLGGRDQVVFERIMKEGHGKTSELPACMASYAEQMLAVPPPTTARARIRDVTGQPDDAMRSVQHIEIEDATLVFTRRRSLSEREATILPEIEQAAADLVAIARAWNHEEPREWLTDHSLIESPPQLIRLFAVVEDGSVLTLPITPTLEEETANLGRNLKEPSLASIVVFGPHDFSRPREQDIHYTGIYPDKLGQGFVVTLVVPGVHEPGQLDLLIAADLGLAISHEQLVANADPSLQLAIARLPSEMRGPSWQPWVTLLSALPTDASAKLLREVHEHALRETQQEQRVDWAPLAFDKTSGGVLFATQLAKDYWLVGLVEDPRPPWPSMLLAPGLLLTLLVWLERRRRASERERRRLDTGARVRDAVLDDLRLALMVIDPNDDKVVHANTTAQRELGLTPGQLVHERLVAADARSQRDYHAHQGLTGGRRRAYGVRLRPASDGPRYALIRSISLTDAIPEFHAAANHRLGVVCPIEGDADLAPVLADELAASRQDERNKLATIIDHGVDVLARVLAGQLRTTDDEDAEDAEFRRWLAEYLFGRLHVTQWILDHWGGPECRDIDCILGPEHLRAALTQYQRVFAWVGHEPLLRAQLRWNNGTLASPLPDGVAAVKLWIDWPDEYLLATPAEGLFGYFLGEALINAIKHGTPGVPIEIDVDLDRARRELCIRVRNPCATHDQDSREDKAYGGSAILTEIARICHWQLSRTLEREVFELRWVCPVTLQRPTGLAD
jgi:hypothetical protein